jgi:hypothetical protein
LTDEDKESALNDVVEFRQVGSKHYKVEKRAPSYSFRHAFAIIGL